MSSTTWWPPSTTSLAVPRHRDEDRRPRHRRRARPERARPALPARPERHARLPRAPGPHRRGARQGRLVLHRRHRVRGRGRLRGAHRPPLALQQDRRRDGAAPGRRGGDRPGRGAGGGQDRGDGRSGRAQGREARRALHAGLRRPRLAAGGARPRPGPAEPLEARPRGLPPRGRDPAARHRQDRPRRRQAPRPLVLPVLTAAAFAKALAPAGRFWHT